MTPDRPAFIDPAPELSGGEVGEARAPRWFVVVAIVLLGLAVAYLVSQVSGPKLSWRHDFVSGTEATETNK